MKVPQRVGYPLTVLIMLWGSAASSFPFHEFWVALLAKSASNRLGFPIQIVKSPNGSGRLYSIPRGGQCKGYPFSLMEKMFPEVDLNADPDREYLASGYALETARLRWNQEHPGGPMLAIGFYEPSLLRPDVPERRFVDRWIDEGKIPISNPAAFLGFENVLFLHDQGHVRYSADVPVEAAAAHREVGKIIRQAARWSDRRSPVGIRLRRLEYSYAASIELLTEYSMPGRKDSRLLIYLEDLDYRVRQFEQDFPESRYLADLHNALQILSRLEITALYQRQERLVDALGSPNRP